MSALMAVSVILPTYNAEAFIGRAIASVAAQTLPPIELLIVDDCSTDRTRVVLAAAARAHAWIRVIALPRNGGPSVARNAGIAAARGHWIAILDADDAFAPDRLAALISFAVATGADVVADDLAYYDAGAGRVTGTGLGPSAPPDGPISARDYLAHNLANGRGLDWGLLKPVFRRAILAARDIGYDPAHRHGEDFRLMVDLLMAGADFRILPQPLYLYTQREGAVSRQTSGMTRTTIAYAALRDATLALRHDPAIAADPALVAFLLERAGGLQRLDDAHFLSLALRAGALGEILARCARDPSFAPFMLWRISRALRRRLRLA